MDYDSTPTLLMPGRWAINTILLYKCATLLQAAGKTATFNNAFTVQASVATMMSKELKPVNKKCP
jgi:hypothetical protein